ncbi:MAG: hypothetical protein J0L76_01510 [Rhodobacterales bacterium]|nr:hypothetical protein [Rhodobacterales bacterium]
MLRVPPRHQLAIAVACVVLNLAVGKIASRLSLPLPVAPVTGPLMLEIEERP